MRIFRAVWRRLINFLDKIVIGLFRLLPVQSNYLVLESEGDFTDNIRVFYNYLIRNNYNESYKIIWIVHNPSEYKKEKNVLFVSRFHQGIHIKADFYIAIARFFIFSHPYWLTDWRSSQVVINTSHSVAQLKAPSKVQSMKIFDYVLACSPYCGDIKSHVFSVSADRILELGMPRIDLMYQHKDCISILYPEYTGKRVLLSMETFKQSKNWNDSSSVDRYAINVVHTHDELLSLDTYLTQNNYVLIIKIHHLQDLSFLKLVTLQSIRYLTDKQLKEYDIQTNELLESADVLLTDYSSVFYEFLIKDRPIGFLLGDFSDYDRGFITNDPLSEMPGEKIYDFEGLKKFLSMSMDGDDNYAPQRKIIRDKVFTFQDQFNCQRLINWLEKNW